MVVLKPLLYAILAWLGLGTRKDEPPTSAPIESVCSGLDVTDGSADCFYGGDMTYCHVFCNDEDQGAYSCSDEDGWHPELPDCARPSGAAVTERAEVLLKERTCDSITCTRSCNDKGFIGGRCVKKPPQCVCS